MARCPGTWTRPSWPRASPARRGGAGRPPADGLPALARRAPARARTRAVARSVQLPARGRAALEPRRLAVRARRTGRCSGASGRSRHGTCSSCSASSARAVSRRSGSGSSGYVAALRWSAGSPSRSRRTSRRSRARVTCLRGSRCSCRCRSMRRAGQARLAWWLALAGAALASIPLSGQLHLALGAIPFFAALRARPPPLGGAARRPGARRGLLADAPPSAERPARADARSRQVEHYSADWPDLLSRDAHGSRGSSTSAGRSPLLARRRARRADPAAPVGLALALGLGALIPILFALGANLPGYRLSGSTSPGLRNTRVPERMMPIACLALAALVARRGLDECAGRESRSIVARALARRPADGPLPRRPPPTSTTRPTQRSRRAGRAACSSSPCSTAGSQSASVYLYYLMQAPREHPSGYSTTAPLAADRRLRQLQKTPCRYLRPLGVRELVTHYDAKNPCGGQLIARSGRIAAYRLR